MRIRILYFISLFLLMLVTGVFWGTWFTLTRSIEDFSPEEFIHIGKVIIKNVAVPMSILMPLTILCMLISLWFYPQKKSYRFYLNIVALVLTIATLLVTLLILVPIDNQVKTWTAANLPPGFGNIRDRWQFFHAVRTFTSLASFGFFTLSAANNK